MIELSNSTFRYKLVRTKELYKNDDQKDMVFIHAMLVEIEYQNFGSTTQKKERFLFSTYKRFAAEEEHSYFFTKKIPCGTFEYDLSKDDFEDLLKASEIDQYYLFKY